MQRAWENEIGARVMRGLKLDPTTLLMLQLSSNGIPNPKREFKFHDIRKWRFDLAWPDKKVAIEIDGGAFAFGGGKHMQPRDLEKLNTAAAMGWKVYRFSPEMIRKSMAIKFLLEYSE